MTQEDKNLLLKDLCARLPYGVKYCRESWNYEWDQEISVVEVLEDIDKDGYINYHKVYTVWDIKPYLRPMSSMTEEEKEELQSLCDGIEIDDDGNHFHYTTIYSDVESFRHVDFDAIDWLNAHHFDYRGLIEKGLAIEVTLENNPYKND